jgi:mRNA interferase RelE/StbE
MLSVNSIYKVKLKKSALKFIKRQDAVRQRQIKELIDLLSKNPYAAPNIRPLEGFKEKIYRIRFGQFRLIYEVKEDELVILVLKIGSRGDVYK